MTSTPKLLRISEGSLCSFSLRVLSHGSSPRLRLREANVGLSLSVPARDPTTGELLLDVVFEDFPVIETPPEIRFCEWTGQ
jgi:hypothetical protein